jgi:hypothetical protein
MSCQILIRVEKDNQGTINFSRSSKYKRNTSTSEQAEVKKMADQRIEISPNLQ